MTHASRMGAIYLCLSVFVSLVCTEKIRAADEQEEKKTLEFPADRSMGKIKVYDSEKSEWKEIGEAKGKVCLPKKQRAILIVNDKGVADLSPFKNLPPDAFDQILFDGLTIPKKALKNLKSLESLRKISLRGCTFEDAELKHVGKLNELTEINLSITPVSDEGIKHLKGLKKLESLDISSTKAGNGCIATLKEMKSLRFLDPQKSQIDEKGIEELREALPECLITER